MTDENGRARDETDRPVTTARDSLAANLVWLLGLVASGYLAYRTLEITFYMFVFMDHGSREFAWRNVADVVLISVSVWLFAAIGYVGLRFWPHGRFRAWGLSAIVLQVALAAFAYADPVRFIDLAIWFD